MCCNNERHGFFEGAEAFWIIVVIAIVIIWVHYYNGCGNNCGMSCNNNCGCEHNNCGCNNNSCC